MKMDTTTMKIDCGPGKVVLINRESVHHIFGFPMGGETVPRPSDTGHDAALAKLKAELGFATNASIETKHLRTLLQELVNDDTKVHEAVKVFFAILYNKLICPGSALRIGREAAMLVDMDYEKMARSDFCQLVVDEVKRAAEKYQDTNIPQAGPEGCVIVPVVQYLDSCLSKKHSIMHRRTPRAKFLYQKPLKAIYLQDRIRNGKNDLSKYIIGKLPVSELCLACQVNLDFCFCYARYLFHIFLFFSICLTSCLLFCLQWKGRNDIAYSYLFPVETLHVQPSPLNAAQPSDLPEIDPNAPMNPRPLSSQAPCVVPPSSSDIPVASCATAIGQIDRLLHKVVDLSRSVPSVDDRLSRLAGLFPPGYLPSSDVLKQVTELDASVLEYLRTAVSFVAKGFAELGMKQDLLCKRYEGEAVIKERQFREEDLAKSFGGISDKGTSSGLGQRDSDAEVK